MAGRSDTMQSHQFARQRITAALAVRDPDAAVSPVRRSAGTAFAGVMLAVVALAAVAAYGVLRPGDSTTWRDGRSVIVERETGARFVYRDGVLHPTLNYASALLILGSAQPATAIVSHASLAGVPRGAPWGIAGAPDPLPAASDLLTGAWSLCSRYATATSGSPVESLLVVGVAPGSAGATTALAADRAVLVRDTSAGYHLLWHGRRFAIGAPEVALTALGYRSTQPIPVDLALLNALPPGDEIAPMRVTGRGQHSAFAGHAVGEVVVAVSQAGDRQFGLVRPDGVAVITQLQADLLLADPGNGGSGRVVSITPAELAGAPTAPSLAPTGDAAPPAVTPELAGLSGHGAVCASFVDATVAPALSLLDERPSLVGETRATRGGVDWVAVPPGRGAVVRSVVSAASGDGVLGVVSDLGVLYPVPGPAVLGTLGFPSATPHPLPSSLVSLLPRGNALDPAAAMAGPA